MNKLTRILGCMIAATVFSASCAHVPVGSKSIPEPSLAIPGPRDYVAFFDPGNLHAFTVEIARVDWDRLNTDMLKHQAEFKSIRTGGYYPARVIYSGINGNVTMEDVGFRTRGNTSRVIPEKSPGAFKRAHFSLKFNESFSMDSQDPRYAERAERRLFSLRGLNLKLAEDSPSVVRELYAYNYMNKIGLKAPRAGMASLELRILETDGSVLSRNFGYYTAIEPVNKSFITSRWGKDGNDGQLYKGLWQQGGPANLNWDEARLKQGTNLLGVEDWTTEYRPSYDLSSVEPEEARASPPEHGALLAFIKKLNELSGAELKTYLDEAFEIEDFLKWMAANLLLGMPDDYRAMANNYYLYFPLQGRKASFIPYDYDHGLGGGWKPYDTANVGIFDVPNLNAQFMRQPEENFPHPLVDKVLAIPEYREAYVRYFEEQVAGPFSYEAYRAFYAQAKGLLKDFDYLGMDGKGPMAAKDSEKAWIDARIKRTRKDIRAFRASLKASPKKGAESLPPAEPLSLDKPAADSGFVELGSGAWGMAFPDEGLRTFSLSMSALDPAVSRVEFSISGGESFAPVIVKDSQPPFSVSFQTEYTSDRFSLSVKAFKKSGKLIWQRNWERLGNPYLSDYVSVEKKEEGRYLFRFRPAKYHSMAIEGVYLRGALDGSGKDWDSALEMKERPAGSGNWEVLTAASPGQPYKFFIDIGPGYPKNSWVGSWYVDKQNPLTDGLGSPSSVVP